MSFFSPRTLLKAFCLFVVLMVPVVPIVAIFFDAWYSYAAPGEPIWGAVIYALSIMALGNLVVVIAVSLVATRNPERKKWWLLFAILGSLPFFFWLFADALRVGLWLGVPFTASGFLTILSAFYWIGVAILGSFYAYLKNSRFLGRVFP